MEYCWIILKLCLLLTLGRNGSTHKTEGDLYTELLEDYEPLERPIANSSDAVLVRMGLVLQQIVDVDEKNQVVDVNAWLKFSWIDYSLNWEPEEYGGVSDLRFRKGQLWTPDVLMYNSADPQFDSRYASNLLVYPNGLVNWMPPGLYRLSCKIQVVWFPFDVQECFLKFGSWTFDGTKLNLEIDENGFDISNYMQNGEWSLEGAFFAVCLFTCACCVTATTLALNFHHRTGKSHQMNRTFRLLMLEWIPWLLMMRRPGFVARGGRIVKEDDSDDEFEERQTRLDQQRIATLISQITVESNKPTPTFPRRVTIVDEVNSNDEEEGRLPPDDVICEEDDVASLEDQSTWRQNPSTSQPPPTPAHLWWNASNRMGNRVPVEQIAQLLVLQQVHGHLSVRQFYRNTDSFLLFQEINKHIREKEKAKKIEDDWKFSAMVVDRICMVIFTGFLFGSTVALFASVPNITRSF
uniref:Neur_chan_LBD domain-containing protein n=1 Tax=Caenorhabditis tropicalis TaxID=1561998 RepID=A0A1I7SYT1_9PELO